MIAAGIMALAIGTFPASLKASCTDIKEEKPAIHRLKGRIIDQDGASVEYVAVGILRLTGNEIDVAVVYPAETKEKTLVSKGARFPAAFGVFNPDDTGTEVGSNVKVKKRFIIKKFSFKVAGRNAVAGAGGIFCEHSIRRMFGKRQERMGGAEDMDREKIRRSLCQQPADVPAVFQVQPCQKRSHGRNITMRTEHRYVGLWH